MHPPQINPPYRRYISTIYPPHPPPVRHTLSITTNLRPHGCHLCLFMYLLAIRLMLFEFLCRFRFESLSAAPCTKTFPSSRRLVGTHLHNLAGVFFAFDSPSVLYSCRNLRAIFYTVHSRSEIRERIAGIVDLHPHTQAALRCLPKK